MAEGLTLLLFSLFLLFCIARNVSVVVALFAGLVLFTAYALYKGFTFREIWQMMLAGLKETRTVLLVFCLIGMLTALWRAAGTIPYIIYHAVSVVNPRFFVLFSFLLCALVSFLTGTAFGTVSTAGIICMMTGKALGLSDFYLGGAILSGIFFGDRCSPMSSSALLVSELTRTDIHRNIKNMMRTSIVPFALAVIFYAASGGPAGEMPATVELSFFAESFNLTPWVLLPAAVILFLTLLRLDIKVTILCSIAAGLLVGLLCQGMSLRDLLKFMFTGYRSGNAEIAALMDGGGILSMLRTALIVAISSSYFGIFRRTKLLDSIKNWSFTLSRYSTDFAAVLAVSVVTAALSCNQTLATMLAYEITEKMFEDRDKLAVFLENTAIVVSPLIPWSIAAVFPLTTIGAPKSSIIYAVYLFALPLWNLAVSYVGRDRARSS